MNESILLLPNIENQAKDSCPPRGAILLESLHAYTEAILSLRSASTHCATTTDTYAACVGLTDKVELNFKRDNNDLARSLVPMALQACGADKNQFFSLLSNSRCNRFN